MQYLFEVHKMLEATAVTTCELAKLIALGDTPNSTASAHKVADQARQIQTWISELKCDKED